LLDKGLEKIYLLTLIFKVYHNNLREHGNMS